MINSYSQLRRLTQPDKQKGAALALLALVILIVGATVLFSALDSRGITIARTKNTAAALAEAKMGLIGYAVLSAAKPGALPCTDNNNDGSADTSGTNSCAAYIGRVPWKQLGISKLKDAVGECLWYALSPIYRNQMTAATRTSNPLNGNTSGSITLVDDAGTPYSASINPVIAVIMAPGSPLAGQNRNGPTSTCPGDSIAAKYLDSKGGINNATGNVSGNNYTFKLGKIDSTFNDQFVYITAKEFYRILRQRMVKEVLGNVDVPSGPVNYFISNGHYPCPAATITGNEDCMLTTGFVPYNDAALGPLQYAALGIWLSSNGWYGLANYSYISSTHVKLNVTDGLGSYTCDANINTFSCSSP